MAGVRVARVGPERGLYSTVPRARQEMAAVDRRRRLAGVGAKWSRVVLCQWTQIDGRFDSDRPDVRRWRTSVALRTFLPTLPLRCRTGWPLHHDQTGRA